MPVAKETLSAFIIKEMANIIIMNLATCFKEGS